MALFIGTVPHKKWGTGQRRYWLISYFEWMGGSCSGHGQGLWPRETPPFVAYAPAHVDDAARENYLQEYQKRLEGLKTTEPIKYPSLSEYDHQTFQRKE